MSFTRSTDFLARMAADGNPFTDLAQLELRLRGVIAHRVALTDRIVLSVPVGGGRWRPVTALFPEAEPQGVAHNPSRSAPRESREEGSA